MNYLNRSPVTANYLKMEDKYIGVLENLHHPSCVLVPKNDLPVLSFKLGMNLDELVALFEQKYVELSFADQRKRFNLYKQWLFDTDGLGYPQPASVPAEVSISRRVAGTNSEFRGGYLECLEKEKKDYVFRTIWERDMRVCYHRGDMLAQYHANINEMFGFEPSGVFNSYVETRSLQMYVECEGEEVVISDPLYNLLVSSDQPYVYVDDILMVLRKMLGNLGMSGNPDFFPGYGRYLSIGCFSHTIEGALFNIAKSPGQHRVHFNLHKNLYSFTVVAVPVQKRSEQYFPTVFSSSKVLARINHIDMPKTNPKSEFDILMSLYRQARISPPESFEADKPCSKELINELSKQEKVMDLIGWTGRQELGGTVVAHVSSIDEFKSIRNLGASYWLYLSYDCCESGLLNYLFTHYAEFEVWKKVDSSFSYGIPVRCGTRVVNNNLVLSSKDYAALNVHYKRYLIASMLEQKLVVPHGMITTYIISDTGNGFPISMNIQRATAFLSGTVMEYKTNRRYVWDDGSTTIVGADVNGLSPWMVDYVPEKRLVITGAICELFGFSGGVVYDRVHNPMINFLNHKYFKDAYPGITFVELMDVMSSLHYNSGNSMNRDVDAVCVRNQIRAKRVKVVYDRSLQFFRFKPAGGLSRTCRPYIAEIINRLPFLRKTEMESTYLSLPHENSYTEYDTGKRILNPCFADIVRYGSKR